MTDEITVTLDMGYDEWTVDEVHDYFAAVGCNAVIASIGIDNALSADFADLVEKCTADGEVPDELVIPPGWQPLNLLSVDPYHMLGFAWIPARRKRPDLSFADFAAEVNAGDLLKAYIESVTEMMPEPVPEDAGAAPLQSNSRKPRKTSRRSRTKSSSATPSNSRSGKSGRSGTASTK